MRVKKVILIFIILLFPIAGWAEKVRLKDIAEIRGVSEGHLFGYGLVVGLNGTGDSTGQVTIQSMSNMLQKLGLTIPAEQIKPKNVAAVMVTAKLPPFAKTGSRVDVTVSSIGDAKSLLGGTLLPTPLRSLYDPNTIYAVAQGEITVGGYSFSAIGAKAQKNHPTVGHIPGGAIIQSEMKVSLLEDERYLVLVLDNPDFTTAARVAQAVDAKFGKRISTPMDGATIRLTLPDEYKDKIVQFICEVESVKVEPDTVARVVIDERTGTVVIGKDVRISTVAVAHGNIRVEISTKFEASQPYPESQGQTVLVPQTSLDVTEEAGSVALLDETATIGQLVQLLNAIGASPQDMIAILQNIERAGALQAKLIVR
jgi:flagellar P-ring protein precursor FlgI